MSFLRSFRCTILAAFALGLAANVPAGAQSIPFIEGGYDAVNSKMILAIVNPTGADLTNVTLTETLIANPAVTDTALIGTVAAGHTATSDMDFFFPLLFGDNPVTLFPGFPFDVTVDATLANGLVSEITFNQDNNLTGGYVQFEGIGQNGRPDGIAVSLTPLASVPEPGALALLAVMGLCGTGLLRRRIQK